MTAPTQTRKPATWTSHVIACPHCDHEIEVLFEPGKPGELWDACQMCGEVLHVVLEDGKVEVD